MRNIFKSAAFGATLVGAAAITAFLGDRGSEEARLELIPPPTQLAMSVSTAADPPPADVPVTGVRRETVEPLSPPERLVPRAPSSVRQVLPELDRQIDDWRRFQPDKLTVAPYPDLPMEFRAAAIREENGRTVWTGRNALEGAFLVSAATADEWHAVLTIPGASTFEIHISGQEATVTEQLPEQEHCGTEQFVHAADAGTATLLAPGAAVAEDPSHHLVDVLFFYDAATLADAHSAAGVQTRILARLESGNLALENSEVTNLRWAFAGLYQVPEYTATAKMEDDLNRITREDNEVGRFVQARARQQGADQVVLLVGGQRDFGGIAWTPGHHAVAYWRSSYMTLVHELAHNFGCRHDRQQEEIADSDNRYNFGHRYVASGRDTGTIMSYADWKVPYFSTPDVTYQGHRLGIREGQPRAAHNVRVLAAGAAGMAAYRQSASAPLITGQPQSVTVNVSATFTVSVTATGPDLAYQWRRNGAAIPGATSATYSKSDAVVADEGGYSVIVSNPSGAVASSTATVTVRAAPAASTSPVATSSPSSGGGGGGGGGSTGGWFAVLLGALLLLRWSRTAR